MSTVSDRKLLYMDYLKRENGKLHQSGADTFHLDKLLQAGDPHAIEEVQNHLVAYLQEAFSADPLRNLQYHFVFCTAIVCNAAISAGLPADQAVNVCGLYIRKLDTLQEPKALNALNADMVRHFAQELGTLDTKRVYSRDVLRSMDFVYEHLYEHLSVQTVANYVGMSRSYFSTLFKNETGISISAYILERRMEAARNMLQFSDLPYAEISALLAFSSQSHFIRVFKQQTGFTPREYRLRFSESVEVDKCRSRQDAQN